MSDDLIIAWLAVLMMLQWGWCVFYATAYAWRDTDLGPVWLTKGAALAIFWTLMLANEFAEVPDGVWSYFVGPLLTVGTFGWVFVTVRTWADRRSDSDRPPTP